ncbi:agmatine deiminase family protein [Aestuariispira insulae]|uniref:Agmatine deiminase n=1 Tax=Aestuariispira insulae TaxID=1461337 RepID=A0A3D9HVG6_9PROT|nr:agmatine deiminase family protein [Aestuariispira insulae]RED53503.1 agmatine deiminase [Aestuariispira insulae]
MRMKRKISRRQFNRFALAGCAAALTKGATISDATTNDLDLTGFYVPEEREDHLRTFMQWPVSKRVHPDPVFREMIQQTIADIANTIVDFEPVVLMMDRKYAMDARRKLDPKIEIWDIPTDDLWCRDSGPLFLIHEDGRQMISHMNFNGWGNKQTHGNDGKIARRVAERLGLPLFDNGIVGEPGGIEADGEGTLIANESCWVNPNRNSQSRDVIEAKLLEAYGADKMIWAPGVKGMDITDDHIDATARFVAPGHVLIQLPEGPDVFPPFSQSIYRTLEILENATDAKGRRLEITKIPEPVNVRVESEDFLASYVNYYVCNGAVVCSQFGDPETDEIARQALGDLYPDREVIALNVDPLGETGGGIHCATQQQPAS